MEDNSIKDYDPQSTILSQRSWLQDGHGYIELEAALIKSCLV
jgi:hypothetical protein